ncbi:MAG: leucine-rich repeat domain-containing protein [Paucimonas sp.]|jgi:hypothetical protein|nr:leucine-rich repeat domain-containing protein [Paucimonas sp.]
MSENTPGFHDLLVKERLPRWLDHLTPEQVARLKHLDDPANDTQVHSATPELRAALDQSLRRNRRLTFALAREMADLRSLPDFAEPLLLGRLQQRFGFSDGDLRQMNFVRFSRDWAWSSLSKELHYKVEPLLQAALQNFEADPEMQPESVAINGEFHTTSFNGYPRYHFRPLPFSATQFARECHDLDLGKRYQAHLDEVFGRPAVRDLAISARREQLQLDLLLTRLRAPHEDHDHLQRLIDGASDDDRPGCSRFSLFGVDVLDAVVIKPVAQSVAVYLYLPGMPQALVRYPTPGACKQALLGQLCDPDFRRRFYGFIQQDKLEHFASVLQRNLTGQTLASERDSLWHAPNDTDLHWIGSTIDSELFGWCQDRHHRRLLNEARQLAVPSADVDEAARQRRLQFWESLGMDVLGVAAFFIPAAGELMMVVFAAQVLDEVYEGVEAWEQGDIDGALDHAKAVALDIGVAVATGAALHYAGKLGGKLVEVIRPDGSPRLWNGDLAPYRVEPPADARVDAQGLLESAGQRYARIGDDHYAVTADADGQRWRILHPDNPRAAQPLFEHNGEGAWVGAHEHPLEWSQATLLRRLGNPVAGYDDGQLEIARQISGTRRDELLDVYLKQRPTPPRLLQTLQRLRTGERATDPLEEALDGLYHPERSVPASERLALLGLPRQPGWPADCTLELRAGDRSGPLLERAGDKLASDGRLILKVAQGYRAVLGDQPQAPVPDLFEALGQAVPELGDDPAALKHTIVEQAQDNPGRTRALVWSGHSGGWNDEGRLLGGFDAAPPPAHYPAPSPSANPLLVRYRRLYPNTTDAQAIEALRQWNDAGLQAHVELRGLEQQLAYLRTALGQWASQAPLRTIARDRLIQCWQRSLRNGDELDFSGIGLGDDDFASLPHLANAFGHVQELNLSTNPLRRIPELLLSQLPPLRVLWASALELRHLPRGLGPRLETLELTDNSISWSSLSQEALAEYPELERLNLSGNPLDTPPDLSVAPNLRDVCLFDCSLRTIPEQLENLTHLEHLDLSSNLITRLSPGLEQNLRPATQRALGLEHNPLDEDTLGRIDAHYHATGIDLMVAEDDYTTLLLDADLPTRNCWERLSRLLPLPYRRDLRRIADEPMYGCAPATTRRRFWFVLRWLEGSPRARAQALRVDAGKLLRFELTADLEQPEPFATQRQKTEHYLKVAIDAVRCDALDLALIARLPQLNDLQLEALRALTLQRLGNDPLLRVRIAPTAQETLNLERVEREARQLDGNWTNTVRLQLRLLTGSNAVGRDALLTEQADGEPTVPFWVKHLEQRYHGQFDQLQEQANEQLLDAEHSLSEGDYLTEANHLRRQLERERKRLLDDLTRSIADGTQTQW